MFSILLLTVVCLCFDFAEFCCGAVWLLVCVWVLLCGFICFVLLFGCCFVSVYVVLVRCCTGWFVCFVLNIVLVLFVLLVFAFRFVGLFGWILLGVLVL